MQGLGRFATGPRYLFAVASWETGSAAFGALCDSGGPPESAEHPLELTLEGGIAFSPEPE